MPEVVVKGVKKRYGDILAVDSVDLEIARGSLFGLLGPNGAGKTTLVHMLTTVLPMTEGNALVAGKDVKKEPGEVRKNIGIVFQDPSTDKRLTAWENMEFHGRMYGIKKEERRRRSENLLKMVELWDRKDDLVEDFSGGMRRRLEIARGFMHRPEVLFLDEPTIGLDPQTRRRIWKYIRRLNEDEEVTVILTTHYMEEADQLCDEVGIMDEGRIVAKGSPEHLKEEMRGDVVFLEMEEGGSFETELNQMDGVKSVEVTDGYVQITVDNGEKAVPRLCSLIGEGGGKIKSLGLRKPTLEDVFIKITGKRIREEPSNHFRRNRK